MPPVKYTLFISLLLCLLVFYLLLKVVIYRYKFRVGYGDGDEKLLKKAISAHANAVENIPLALFMLLLLELNGGADWLLLTLGGILIVARLIHVGGLMSSLGASFGRTWGTIITWVVTLSAGFINAVSIIF